LREERRLREFENRVLSERDEVTGGWRKLHNEELNDVKSTMRWAGHVARMGRGEVFTGIMWENLRERDHL
jgi:hypothetical protein